MNPEDRRLMIMSPNFFGPKQADHPSIGRPCPACGVPFAAGDCTTVIALGPGSDPEQRERAAKGRPYSAVGIEVHWACATGLEDEAGEEGGDET